jgi:hypothetical protein
MAERNPSSRSAEERAAFRERIAIAQEAAELLTDKELQIIHSDNTTRGHSDAGSQRQGEDRTGGRSDERSNRSSNSRQAVCPIDRDCRLTGSCDMTLCPAMGDIYRSR